MKRVRRGVPSRDGSAALSGSHPNEGRATQSRVMADPTKTGMVPCVRFASRRHCVVWLAVPGLGYFALKSRAAVTARQKRSRGRGHERAH